MKLPKQIINLIGAVLVLVILAGGIALVALPAWNGAQTTDASARSVAQTNDIYEIDLKRLAAAEGDFSVIEASLGALREEIADIPRLDDVYELVVAGAAETGVTVTELVAEDPDVWLSRGPVTVAPGRDGQAEEPAPVEEAPAVEPNTSEVAGDEAEPVEGTVETTETVSPQRQVTVSIKVEVGDAAQAVAFMDSLGRGPRLLPIVSGTLEDGNDVLTLTVTVQALIRTED